MLTINRQVPCKRIAATPTPVLALDSEAMRAVRDLYDHVTADGQPWPADGMLVIKITLYSEAELSEALDAHKLLGGAQ